MAAESSFRVIPRQINEPIYLTFFDFDEIWFTSWVHQEKNPQQISASQLT